MRYFLHGVFVLSVLTLATPIEAKPYSGADRRAVGGAFYLVPDRHAVSDTNYWHYDKPRAKYKEPRRKKQRNHIHLVRPVVAPQRFIPVDPTDVLARQAPLRPRPDLNLVTLAMRYLGTNPTGWRSVWCGRFMAMIAPHAARRLRNPNWARDWAALPRVEPRPGAIAVLTRGHGGHVGVIKEVKRNGDLVIVSGNHRRKVGIGTYSRSRLIAAVVA